jgi:hypothetical protein
LKVLYNSLIITFYYIILKKRSRTDLDALFMDNQCKYW